MQKKKIIAIDDQPENLQLIVQILKDDYSVIASTSGLMAIDLVKKHPDAGVILLDVFMPDINGFDVLERLRSSVETSHIPVIIVTGHDCEKEYDKGLQLGAYDFVSKPISPSLLKNRINKVLNNG